MVTHLIRHQSPYYTHDNQWDMQYIINYNIPINPHTIPLQQTQVPINQVGFIAICKISHLIEFQSRQFDGINNVY